MKLLATTLTAAALLAACICAHAGSIVTASEYYPGDGIVKPWDYATSSGERYNAKAMKCACLDYPLGTRLYLQRGHNAADVICNDRGTCGDGPECKHPFKNRRLDLTPAVNDALHLDGLGSVTVTPWPPLPRARPIEANNFGEGLGLGLLHVLGKAGAQ